ncbi:hypothetical protein HMPREF1624_07611 [Sporothrix schenckii ATCC 58251]|uniref:Protein DSF2 n=1 Tax=Sporothrix schenckii (strain ATCC 58251 / de Perez 2211183) TaxID=1391915 RepID=U7PNK8_SPOS1|nr:hypothetical protein HMPREF1624_07611 [Sporothrix schenckii ATCC 58251]
MGLRDILKKKGGSDDEGGFTDSRNESEFDQFQHQYQQEFPSQSQSQLQPQRRRTPPPRPPPPDPLQTSEFTFIRSDTLSQEVIHPPADVDDFGRNQYLQAGGGSNDGGLASPASPQNHRRSFDMFRKSSRSGRSSRSASVSSSGMAGDGSNAAAESTARRLSQRLHLSRTPSTSSHVPTNLPEIVVPEGEGEGGNRPVGHSSSLSLSSQGSSSSTRGGEAPTSAPVPSAQNSKPAPVNPAVESQWEKRATMLAQENEKVQQLQGSRPGTPEDRLGRKGAASPAGSTHSRSRSRSNSNANGAVSSKELDANIQEAIRLHEEGELEQSTRMFGILADPRGYNNPLSQVLYGLALRHGWGCSPDTETAVQYLSAAASNAAAVEELALKAGINKGGAAKGELVLAIFELANCFRNGWGLDRDPLAAKQYYETAANLGDTDAMNEVAWCYLEGFGCKKDKFLASKYYRLAEQNGNKTLGNSWIWKEKYDPDKQKKK